jgi:hypothetical protein
MKLMKHQKQSNINYRHRRAYKDAKHDGKKGHGNMELMLPMGLSSMTNRMETWKAMKLMEA